VKLLGEIQELYLLIWWLSMDFLFAHTLMTSMKWNVRSERKIKLFHGSVDGSVEFTPRRVQKDSFWFLESSTICIWSQVLYFVQESRLLLCFEIKLYCTIIKYVPRVSFEISNPQFRLHHDLRLLRRSSNLTLLGFFTSASSSLRFTKAQHINHQIELVRPETKPPNHFKTTLRT